MDEEDFNWDFVQWGQAFETVDNQLLWYCYNLAERFQVAMTDEEGDMVSYHSLGLIRRPGYDFRIMRVAA